MSDKGIFLLILGIVLLLVFRNHGVSGFANVATPNTKTSGNTVIKIHPIVAEEHNAVPVTKRIQIRELLNDECKKCGTKVNNRCKTACSRFDPRLLHHMQDMDRLGAVRAIRLMCEGDHRGDYEAIDNCKRFYGDQYNQLVPNGTRIKK